jgi:hypothetical protein
MQRRSKRTTKAICFFSTGIATGERAGKDSLLPEMFLFIYATSPSAICYLSTLNIGRRCCEGLVKTPNNGGVLIFN